jgi:hypothetical protein
VLDSLTGRRHCTGKLDRINADPKGNFYRLARKKKISNLNVKIRTDQKVPRSVNTGRRVRQG